MLSPFPAFTVLSILLLAACDGGGTPGGTPAPGGANGGVVPPQAGGGTGGRCKATGEICSLFFAEKGWEFRVATTYSPGRDPKVSTMAGRAVFKADGTFVQDYTVGSLTVRNHYEGTFKLDGRFFTGKTSEGETLEYVLACDKGLKELVITFPNDDAACSPSLIFGLKLIEN